MKNEDKKYKVWIWCFGSGMKFQMKRPNQKEIILEIVSFEEAEEGYIDVCIKQEDQENIQAWRRYPKRKCALEFELTLVEPKGRVVLNVNPVS